MTTSIILLTFSFWQKMYGFVINIGNTFCLETEDNYGIWFQIGHLFPKHKREALFSECRSAWQYVILLYGIFQVMVTNVKSLLETVKTVEDEAARGTRALESSIDAIGHEIRVKISMFLLLSNTEYILNVAYFELKYRFKYIFNFMVLLRN